MMNALNLDLESNNDDDFFGSMGRRSNLGQLFGIDSTTNHPSEHDTLKYQPTKQQALRQTTPATAQTAQQWSTEIVKIANAYKEGESVGKVGVALLRNDENACKIIVYKTKTNVLTTLTLIKEQQLHQQSRYLQFYDDAQLYWSLLFDSLEDDEAFAKKCAEFNIRILHNITTTKDLLPKENNRIKNENLPLLKAVTEEDTDPLSAAAKRDSHSKASLITRMAKMGQQLPKLSTVQQQHSTGECSDSSDLEIIDTASSKKPIIMPRNKLPLKTQVVATTSATHLNAYHGDAENINQIETQFLQMMLTENRTQNTEIRMNMNKLETKIEKVLDKMDMLNTSTNCKSNNEDEMLELEEKVLELKKENRKLKQMLSNKEHQHKDEQVLKNLLKIYEVELEEYGITETNDMEKLLSTLLDKLRTLTENTEKHLNELMLQNKELQVKDFNLQQATAKHLNVSSQLDELESLNQSLKSTVAQKDNEFQVLQQQLQDQTKTHNELMEKQIMQTETVIKTIMNNLYGNLVDKLENAKSSENDDVLAVIGKTIREESLKAMQQIKQ